MKRFSSVLIAHLLFAPPAGAVDLTQVPRTIAKEPAYQSQPKYCLLVFGPEAKTHVWLVHDGDTLYADRNANSDLTDADERIAAKIADAEKGTFHFDMGDVRDGDLLHKSLTVSTMNLDHLKGNERFVTEALANDPQTRFYGVTLEIEMPGRRGIGVGGRVQQSAFALDANGVLQFSETIENAPIIHFGNALWQVTLYNQANLIVGRQREVYLGLGTPGLGPGTTAFIAYENVVPPAVCPKLEIMFSSDSDVARKERYVLTERCCTYNFHGGVRIPDDVSPGEATVTISLDDWIGGFVAPTTHRIPLVAPKVALTLEPVSPRRTRSLMHPTRDAMLVGIQYSPDGTRIVAGDYPGGVIQVWHPATAEQLVTIDTTTGRHYATEYIQITPDWSSVYAARPQRKYTRIERDGQTLMRWQFDADIREWDLSSGELRRVLQHTPARNILVLVLSPDGRSFVTGDELPGEFEGAPPRKVSLWDVETGTARDIGAGSGYGVFSPDSRRVAIEEMTDNYEVTAVNMVDTASGKQELTIPIEFPRSHVYPQLTLMGCSPDGRTLIGRSISYPDKNDLSTRQSSLDFWETNSGEKIGSISANRGEAFSWPAAFSPDGRMLAVTNEQGQRPELYFIDLARKEITATVELAEEQAVARAQAFSPNARWVAVVTQVFPKEVSRLYPAAEDVPQPRIHLVDTETAEIVETIIAPQCFMSSLCFSPDGRTLASGGNGRVLLWDLSTPPGQLATK